MAPPKSDQNGSNQPAPPRQDQTDQGPTTSANYTEQGEQPMEQEVVMAIMRPGDSSIAISGQERAEYEERARLASYEPLPDDDDFADEPLPKPYDPKSSTPYDWAKPEAWIQEKDSEGNGYRRASLSIINIKQDEQCGATKSRRWLDTRHQRALSATPPSDIPEPKDHGSEGMVRK
jgi:hypothetical protein